MTAAEPSDVVARSNGVSRRAAAHDGVSPASAERDADAAVTALYAAHYRSLVRLAALLVLDTHAAEEVVQDSFVALHRGWRWLAGRDRELWYLRQSVVNRSRSARRRAPQCSAQCSAQGPSAVVAAMQTLPLRQREAFALRYYAGLSDSAAARMMGVSTSAVQRHTTQAIASLQSVLERPA
jgi:DNA-directed RNA polymerase specialized sigma24 family protein